MTNDTTTADAKIFELAEMLVRLAARVEVLVESNSPAPPPPARPALRLIAGEGQTSVSDLRPLLLVVGGEWL